MSDLPGESVHPIMSFVLLATIGGAALQWIVSLVPINTAPVSVLWFLMGAVVATINYFGNMRLLGEGLSSAGTINADILYFFLLPILLYEATQNVNWYKMRQFFVSGLTLAVIGVAFQVAIVGLLMRSTFGADIGWTPSFLIAATLTSTDPVAVISVMNNLSSPDNKLSSMFDGESLINDGTSILLFQFFRDLSAGESESVGGVMLNFVTLLFVGPIFGLVCAYIIYLWISKFRRHHMMQGIAVIFSSYMVYFVAERHFGSSGPLTIVSYGLFFRAYGRIAFDHEAAEKHDGLAEGLGLTANALIFVISGVITARMLFDTTHGHSGLELRGWHIPVLYVYLIIARAIMLLCASPVLKKSGYGLTLAEGALFWWGGLRGAVSLILGLMLEQDQYVQSTLASQAVFYISGSVLLVLVINGSTFEFLYRWLNPYPPNCFKRVYLERVMKLIDLDYIKERKFLNDYWVFKMTDVLVYADRVIPILGWRKINRRGNIDVALPWIDEAFDDVPKFDTWEPPEEDFISKIEEIAQRARVALHEDHPEGARRIISPAYLVRKRFKQRGSDESLGGSSGMRGHNKVATCQTLQARKMALDLKTNLRLVEHAFEDVALGDYISELEDLALYLEREQMAIRGPKLRQDFLREYESNYPARMDTDGTIQFPDSPPESPRLSMESIIRPPRAVPPPSPAPDVSLHIIGEDPKDVPILDVPWKRRSRLVVGKLISDPGDRRSDSPSSDLSVFSLPADSITSGGSHEYFEVPRTPRRGESTTDPRLLRVKVLRVQRHAELYVMVFNAIRLMYGRLYKVGFIGGTALLSLHTSLDRATDMANRQIQQKPSHALDEAEAEDEPAHVPPELKRIKEKLKDTNNTEISCFEAEWFFLASKLYCVKGTYATYIPIQQLRVPVLYQYALTDLQSVVAYVDTHEELLEKGGGSLRNLLGNRLLTLYERQIQVAKQFMLHIRTFYGECFHYCLVNYAALTLLNLKLQLLEDQHEKGLIFEDDIHKFRNLFEDQHFNLVAYRPWPFRLPSWVRRRRSPYSFGVQRSPDDPSFNGGP